MKVICVESNEEDFKIDKVYEYENNRLIDDSGFNWLGGENTTLDQWNSILWDDAPLKIAKFEAVAPCKKMTYLEAAKRISEHNLIHHINEHPHAQHITEALNMAVDVLTKLAEEDAFTELEGYRQDEKDGLLKRLPCKVGSILYQPHESTLYDCESDECLVEYELGCKECPYCVEVVERTVRKIFARSLSTLEHYLPQIGKTVFLTPQEAENHMESKDTIVYGVSLCPECERITDYDPHFDRTYCTNTNCGWSKKGKV